ncbi:MAG: GntR family transcriptional regulator [Planctomycetes bacterium]|nr:GntR family transcriptional regulator [Planctomycetota bacterium]
MALNNQAASIDRQSPLPMYHQLKEILLERIKNQPIAAGKSFPSEMELIETYEVSRTTVRQAIAELTKQGYLYIIKGKGAFVSRPKIDLRYLQKALTFDEQIRKSGMTPTTQVLFFKEIAAPDDVAYALGTSRVLKLERLRFADGEPIVLVESYHPYDLCAFLLGHDLEKNSLYDTLALSPETKVVRVERTVEAIAANRDLAKALKIKVGFPVQHFHTHAYAGNDRVVEYCISDYRGDRNKLSVEIILTD